MKYNPQHYAHAFADLTHGALTPERERTLTKNFLELVRKNGDWAKIKKILAETEKLLRKISGRRKVVIETARPLKNLEQSFKKLIALKDIVEKKLDPELVAGVKITVNDETQFDASFKTKLEKLFSSNPLA